MCVYSLRSTCTGTRTVKLKLHCKDRLELYIQYNLSQVITPVHFSLRHFVLKKNQEGARVFRPHEKFEIPNLEVYSCIM